MFAIIYFDMTLTKEQFHSKQDAFNWLVKHYGETQATNRDFKIVPAMIGLA
jgi:hypothetical protein